MRSESCWVATGVLSLMLLPGCLGRLGGARPGPDPPQPFPPAKEIPGRAIVIEAAAGDPQPPSVPPVAPPPSEANSKSPSFSQTSVEKPEPPSTIQTAAAQPAPPPPPAELQGGLQKAKLALASSDPPLLGALRFFLNDEPDKALEHLKGFDAATRDFLIRLLPALAGLGQKPLEQLNSEEIAVLQQQFEQMLEALRPFTHLAISRMCCCQWIKGYGNYEPLPEGHLFRAASARGVRDGEQVKLYVELRNFRCELRDRYHEIRLCSSVEIRDPHDPPEAQPLWRLRFDDQKEPVRSRAQLHDFFNYYTFSVPWLPPGTYTLTFQVSDETMPERRRVARMSQEFRVTAMPVP